MSAVYAILAVANTLLFAVLAYNGVFGYMQLLFAVGFGLAFYFRRP